jgi:hypothetical protein
MCSDSRNAVGAAAPTLEALGRLVPKTQEVAEEKQVIERKLVLGRPFNLS